MRRAVTLALTCWTLGGVAAHAQNAPVAPNPWYVSGESGWVGVDSPARGHVAGAQWRQNIASGFNLGARIGYEQAPLRFEGEYRFLQNDISKIAIGGLTSKVTGRRKAHAVLANAIYDFNIRDGGLTPHIGVGIGAVNLKDAIAAPTVGAISHSSDLQFGYQATAGLRYNISPSLAFDVDYRYLGTTTPSFKGTAPLNGSHYTSSFDSHSLVASLTFRLGTPSPPPAAVQPAPPAPPVARKVFIVFMDWDRDTVTPDAVQIIQRAADAFSAGTPVTIQVTGYTDRSGSAGYNQRLSDRRADHVAGALLGMGIPGSKMSISGRGETENLVPVAEGGREPRNRRVEIVVSPGLQSCFPWPPPMPYTQDTLSRDLFTKGTRTSWGDVATKITSELRAAGYSGFTFCSVPDGFAIITPTERVDATGRPAPIPDRWSDIDDVPFPPPRLFSPEYWSAFFKGRRGYGRLFIFVITAQDLVTDPNEKASAEMARHWRDHGNASLPDSVAARPFSPRHKVYALLYLIKKTDGQVAELVTEGTVADQFRTLNLFQK